MKYPDLTEADDNGDYVIYPKPTTQEIKMPKTTVYQKAVSLVGNTYYIPIGDAIRRQCAPADLGQALAPSLDNGTICVIVLTNGMSVTGESFCQYTEDYNLEIGKKSAYDQAFDKVCTIASAMLHSENSTEVVVNQEATDTGIKIQQAVADIIVGNHGGE
ncbi:MAG: hypothetical protein [Bacteriophage sp.]|nr:MAG: hypothetical protein [Bacteriophage sp.]